MLGLGQVGGSVPPGALQPDTARAILVFSETGEPAVALRDHIPPHRALIRDVRPREARAALAACVPYPLLVTGEGAFPAPLVALLRRAPVLARWMAPLPPPIGTRGVAHERFLDLVVDVCQLLAREVAGMRLAPSQGVLMPDGRVVASPPLQALIAAHPGGFSLERAAFPGVANLLRRHSVRARLARNEATGETVLR
jgi:hypothetical protein